MGTRSRPLERRSKRDLGDSTKCLDTTFLVDLVQAPKEVEEVAQRLHEAGEIAATTALNVYEALLGAYALRDRRKGAKIEDKLDKAFARIAILPVREEDARRAAKIAGNLRRRGHHLGVDVLVASVAANHGCDGIVTRNLDHFRRLETLTGLKVLPY